MASKTLPLNASAYTQLDTGPGDTAVYIVNVGVVGIRVIFAVAQPAVGAEGWQFVRPGEVAAREGGTNLMWGLQAGALIGETAKVTVIE